jgi:hypothetical protein
MNTEIVVTTPQSVSLGTLAASTPDALVGGAALMANALAPIIEKQKLFTMISGKKHVKVEGWQTLALFCGCTPREVSTTSNDDGVYTAIVEMVRIADGVVVSRASAECGYSDEPRWKGASHSARRSMAQTRATSKAARMAFSWIMSLAGYEVTPAEEMEDLPPLEAVRPVINQPAMIGPEKEAVIESMIATNGLRRGYFIKTWNVKNFHEIPYQNFERCMADIAQAIEQKRLRDQEAA